MLIYFVKVTSDFVKTANKTYLLVLYFKQYLRNEACSEPIHSVDSLILFNI